MTSAATMLRGFTVAAIVLAGKPRLSIGGAAFLLCYCERTNTRATPNG